MRSTPHSSSKLSAGRRGRGDRPEPSQARSPPPPRVQSLSAHSPRNLRVSDLWGSSGLPPLPSVPAPRSRERAPRERAPGAGGWVRGAGRALRGAGGGGGEKRGEEGPGGRPQGPALPAPRTFATAARAQCGVAGRCARPSPPPPLRDPAFPGRLRRRARGRAHERTAQGTPRPAPPGRAMWIVLPGPARGISAARPAAPVTRGDYEPESAALPGPPLSQPGSGLPPDRVRASQPLHAGPAKLAWPGEGCAAREPPPPPTSVAPPERPGGQGAGEAGAQRPRGQAPQLWYLSSRGPSGRTRRPEDA